METFNVPQFHRRLWREFADATPAAAPILASGEKGAHGFATDFAPEVFHRLYSSSPNAVEAPRSAAPRAKLHALASELPEFEAIRRGTAGDQLWSGIGTLAIADAIARALPSLPPDSPDAAEAQRVLDGLQELAEDSDSPETYADQIEAAQANLDAATAAAEAQASAIDPSAVRRALRRAIGQASAEIEAAQDTLRVLGYGSGSGVGARKDPKVAIELARRAKSSKKLAKIVELAGRMIGISRAKRATKSEYERTEVVGVEMTNRFDRLVGSELALLGLGALGTDLAVRVSERRALGMRLEGKTPSKKGPIVLVVDQSGSMSADGKDEWAKGLALAILDAARSQKRPFGIVLYDDAVLHARLFPVPAEASPTEILDLLSTDPVGGTYYAPALRRALEWIQAGGKFSKADVVHVTDGQASTDGAPAFLEAAAKASCNVQGIAIVKRGEDATALRAWSHEIAVIDDVTRDSPAMDLVFDRV